MWTRCFLFLSVFSLSNASHFGSSGRLFATVTPRRAAVLAESSTTDDILKLRGGAGPLDPSIVIKTGSVVAAINGLLTQFAPVESAVAYGLDEEGSKKPMNKVAASYAGTTMLAYATTCAYLGFANNATAKGAFTVCLHIWVYENLRNWLGKTMEKAGGSSNGVKALLLVELLGLFGMTQDYSDTVLKILGVVFSLSGLHMVVNPGGATKLWNDYEESDEICKAWVQCMGFGILAQSLMFVAMSFFDFDGLKAVGLGSVSWFLLHLYGVMSGTDEKLGIPLNPRLFWMAFNAVIVYTLLF